MMDATVARNIFNEDLYQLTSRVLVLIPSEWETVPDNDQQLLARILGSVKLSLAAVQIVSAQGFSMADAAIYQPGTILSFGVPFAGSAGLYEAKKLGGVQVVSAHAISELDDVRKKNLWVALRQVFQI